MTNPNMSASYLLCFLFFSLLLTQGHASSPRVRQHDHGSSGLPRSQQCRATSGTAGWPSNSTWAQFNQSLGGRLIRASPPGAVCHPGQPTYDPDRCPAVTAGWTTYDFHQADPISNMWNQYSNDSCLPNVTYPCDPAGYPAYAVNATSAEHVKLSFEYVSKNNVRVVVKSSGHDYQGRSTAPGALTIWIHHMQGLEIHQSSFQPKGCNISIDGPAVTAAGGTQMKTLYEELDKINRTIVGGGGKTVAVGGYITGGGHSILAPRYGLAADQVLEMEIVTPKGHILTANECQNQDLFWAMRGGGGSTFGVATSITMATHPSPQIVALDGPIATYDVGQPWFWDMLGYIMSQFPYLDAHGVSGYSFYYPNIPNPLDGGATHVGAFSMAFIIQDTQDPAAMDAIWQPILAHVNQIWPQAITNMTNTTVYPSFLAWYADHYDQGKAGADEYAGSRLVGADAFANATAIAQALQAFSSPSGTGSVYLVVGNGVRNAQPRGGGDAVCPAWRKALVHAINGIAFQPLDPAVREKSLVTLNAGVEPLRQLSPGMGAYVNENNPGEPDWQHSFWGDNYDRLLKIKRDVDPLDTLWCHPCVGNERWKEVGYQLCRV